LPWRVLSSHVARVLERRMDSKLGHARARRFWALTQHLGAARGGPALVLQGSCTRAAPGRQHSPPPPRRHQHHALRPGQLQPSNAPVARASAPGDAAPAPAGLRTTGAAAAAAGGVVYRRMARVEVEAKLADIDRGERRGAHYRVQAGGAVVRHEADEVNKKSTGSAQNSQVGPRSRLKLPIRVLKLAQNLWANPRANITSGAPGLAAGAPRADRGGHPAVHRQWRGGVGGLRQRAAGGDAGT
jgi:hypothetical protein